MEEVGIPGQEDSSPLEERCWVIHREETGSPSRLLRTSSKIVFTILFLTSETFHRYTEHIL